MGTRARLETRQSSVFSFASAASRHRENVHPSSIENWNSATTS